MQASKPTPGTGHLAIPLRPTSTDSIVKDQGEHCSPLQQQSPSYRGRQPLGCLADHIANVHPSEIVIRDHALGRFPFRLILP